MRLLFFLVLTACVFGLSRSTGVCPCPRADLKQCVLDLLDLDLNGSITPTEVDTFINATAVSGGCLADNEDFRANVNAAFVFSMCDTNADNVLNTVDWDDAGSCLQNPMAMNYVCQLCYTCGWEGITIV